MRLARSLLVALTVLSAAPVAAAPEGQMIWAVHVSLAPTWFDPAETSGIITPFVVLYALHDALVKPLPGNAMAPALAESWSASADGLVFDFVLRRGVKFHNGDPITAEDVKFSLERYRGASHKMLKDRVQAIETPDPGRVRIRLKEYTEKKYKNLIQAGSGAFGNAATRIEAFVAGGGAYAYGSYPDIDGLFREQAGEMDRKRREATLHRIQQLVHDKVMVAPIWQLAAMSGVGPRVEESGIGLLAGYAFFSAPYEDVKLKPK